MNSNKFVRKWGLAASLILGTGSVIVESAAAQSPEITITQPARRGPGGESPMDDIAGSVKNSPQGTHVVIYSLAGGTWYVQPWTNNYSTAIQNGKWSNRIHLGETYAAILTTTGWKAPRTLGKLPAVGGDILAIHQVAGR